MRFTPFWVSLMGDLQKSDCYGLNSERKKVLTSSPGPLTCLLINLSAFGSMNIHFPSEKSILPYFSSPRGVTTSVPFLEVRIKKGLRAVYPSAEFSPAFACTSLADLADFPAVFLHISNFDICHEIQQAVVTDKYKYKIS